MNEACKKGTYGLLWEVEKDLFRLGPNVVLKGQCSSTEGNDECRNPLAQGSRAHGLKDEVLYSNSGLDKQVSQSPSFFRGCGLASNDNFKVDDYAIDQSRPISIAACWSISVSTVKRTSTS